MMKPIGATFYSAIIFSALFYASSFLWIEHCWFLNLIFLVPLYHVFFNHPKVFSFKAGFIWGALTYLLQTVAIFDFIIQKSASFLGLLVYVSVIFLMSCVAGCWFLSMRMCGDLAKKLRILGLVLSSWLFFLFIHKLVLIPFSGTSMGYPFSFPLLPLFYKSLLVQKLVCFVGGAVMCVGFIIFQIMLACRRYTITLLFLSVGLCAQWSGFSLRETNQKSSYYAIPAPKNLSTAPYQCAIKLADLLSEASLLHSDIRVFIFPEAVFPFWDPDDQKCLVKMLSDYCHKEAYLILGLYRREGEFCYNSCICIHKGLVLYTYDKQFLIPFFEYMPVWCGNRFEVLNGIDFSAGESTQLQCWDLKEYGIVEPKICAELFWAKKSDSKVIVGLVSDRWFRYGYFSRIMKIYAHYEAASKRKKVWYSGYGVSK